MKSKPLDAGSAGVLTHATEATAEGKFVSAVRWRETTNKCAGGIFGGLVLVVVQHPV